MMITKNDTRQDEWDRRFLEELQLKARIKEFPELYNVVPVGPNWQPQPYTLELMKLHGIIQLSDCIVEKLKPS